MQAILAMLALEDGRIFRGRGFGAPVEAAGEVVFNTSLTGYQEIFTDPSYAGQIVVLTNPHIGNYGTTPSDAESSRPYIEGLVTRDESEAQEKLLTAMKAHGLVKYRCDSEDLEVEIVPEGEKAKVRKVAPPSGESDDGDE